MEMIPRVFRFQTSVETVRAHHWRSMTDAYSGCSFNCQYCLYKGPDDYGAHVHVARGEVTADSSVGILNIGSSTDPYQPIEATERVTRRILESCVDAKVPVFLLTRGTLIKRDVDVLSDLAAQGLLEICLSIITLNQDLSDKIEPRAPAPRERLAMAEYLVEQGLPVTFHVAPLIPGLDSEADLTVLGRTLGGVSGRHVFCAVLGLQRAFWASFQQVMKEVSHLCHDYEQFIDAYPDVQNFSRTSAVTCELPQALPALTAVRAGVNESGALFISENYPYLSTGALEQGIYRWKLPTIYDMAAWAAAQNRPVGWDEFDAWYGAFGPSDELRKLVHDAWVSGELMLGTRLDRVVDEENKDEVQYQYIPDYVSTPAHSTLVTRKVAVIKSH